MRTSVGVTAACAVATVLSAGGWASGEMVFVPPVVITALHHQNFIDFDGFRNLRDGVTFPSGPGAFSGPGFTASIGTGDEVVVRFAAPPGKRFAVNTPQQATGRFFYVNAIWRTGLGDAGSMFVQGTVTWEGLEGTAPTQTFAQDGMFNSGQAFKILHNFTVSAPFKFSAMEVRFVVPFALADVSRTYGTVSSTSVPSFVAVAIGPESMPDSTIMTIENVVPPCPGDANADGLVNSADLSVLLGNFGSSTNGGASSGDLNEDGLVNSADLSVMLAAFGAVC